MKLGDDNLEEKGRIERGKTKRKRVVKEGSKGRKEIAIITFNLCNHLIMITMS